MYVENTWLLFYKNGTMRQLIKQIAEQYHPSENEAVAIINLPVNYVEENAPVLGNSLSYVFNTYSPEMSVSADW